MAEPVNHVKILDSGAMQAMGEFEAGYDLISLAHICLQFP